MDCGKHKGMIVAHAFSTGDCIKCGTEVTTSHIPCNKVCDSCSEKHSLCEICGDLIIKDMKEDLITFETAELAKEKGFPQDISYNKYLSDGKTMTDSHYENKLVKEYRENLTAAPTQTLLQKWLRKFHDIHVVSKPFHDYKEDKTTFVSDVITKKYPNRILKSPRCDEHEESMEFALKLALDLI